MTPLPDHSPQWATSTPVGYSIEWGDMKVTAPTYAEAVSMYEWMKGEALTDEQRERAALLGMGIENVVSWERSLRILRNHNVRTVGDLVAMHEHTLLGLPGFGRTSLRQIRRALSERGLFLGMKPDSPHLPPEGDDNEEDDDEPADDEE